MWEKLIIFVFLFLAAMITVYVISWVGSVLHSIPNGGDSGYAVFTFRSDQDKSMAINILMNVLIPNVCLIFLNLIFYNFNKRYQPDILLYYAVLDSVKSFSQKLNSVVW